MHWTEHIQIPTKYCYLIESDEIHSKTFGSLLESACNWENGTWQKHVCGKSRCELIINAITQNQINQSLEEMK